jgi:general secretion pathway protein D
LFARLAKLITKSKSPNLAGATVKRLIVLFLFAGAGDVLQAQNGGTPPPLLSPPSMPAFTPRTNRFAAQGNTNIPSRITRTNAVAGFTNAARLPANPLTNGALTGAAAVPPSLGTPAPAPAVNAITPATPVTPPTVPAFGQTSPNAVPTVAAPATNLAAGANTNAADDMIPPGMIAFQETDVSQVLQIYQELTGRTVMRPSTLPKTAITIKTQTPLTRREAIQALDTILAMNQITMIPQGDKFVKAVPQGQATTEAAPFNEAAPEELSETTRYITQIVQLKNALPQEVGPALAPLAKLPGQSIMAIPSANILVLRDYEENIKRMLELLEKIDVVPQQDFEPIVIPIKYALASDIATVLGSLTAGGGGAGTVVGRQQTRSGLSTGGTGFGQQGAGGLGGVGGLGGLGAGGYNNQQYNPQGGAAGGFSSQSAGRSSFAGRLQGIVNRAGAAGGVGGGDIVVLGQTKIIADERTNSLLIFAAKEDIKTIKDIIAKLDVVLPQVLIEAIIMEVSLNNSLDYGFSYLQSPKTSGQLTGAGGVNNGQAFQDLKNFGSLGTNGTSTLPSGFSYFAKWGNNFDLAMQAVATDGRINVLSRPRIQTSHAEEANLFVGETRPYITSTYSYLGSGPSAQYSQLQIGITLSVKPLINSDGLVVMDIRQKIQSLGNDVIISGNPVPQTIDREANAKVSVRDKETIILGGFISSEHRKAASGVPFLKDLPILGGLFRSTSKKEVRNELMVMIRPTVLPTPEIAAVVARDEKGKLPGITSAERETNETERKRLEKVQREVSRDLLKREGFGDPDTSANPAR